MKEKQLRKCDAFRWKQFNHKAYSVFCSLKKEVNIGVLTFATLAFANVSPLSAQTEVKTTDQSTVALDEITLLDAIEIIPCTDKAEKSIRSVAEWKI